MARLDSSSSPPKKKKTVFTTAKSMIFSLQHNRCSYIASSLGRCSPHKVYIQSSRTCTPALKGVANKCLQETLSPSYHEYTLYRMQAVCDPVIVET